MMRFRKGGGRNRKMIWRQRRKELEELKEYKYLGFVFQRNGGREAHVKDKVRRKK